MIFLSNKKEKILFAKGKITEKNNPQLAQLTLLNYSNLLTLNSTNLTG
jgi:hypothetical protein